MKNEKEIKQIAEHYGYKHQKKILVEELSELIQAVIKVDRAEGSLSDVLKNYDNLIEEIADCEIMIFQIKHLLAINTDDFIEKKVTRQIERIKHETVH
jgi:NTP pyrophosphatase (non-canonical NTP hydrolase)